MTSSHEKVNLLLSLSGRMWKVDGGKSRPDVRDFAIGSLVLFAAAPSSNFIVFKTFTQYSILSSVNTGTQIKFSGLVLYSGRGCFSRETDATGRLGKIPKELTTVRVLPVTTNLNNKRVQAAWEPPYVSGGLSYEARDTCHSSTYPPHVDCFFFFQTFKIATTIASK